MDGSGTSVLGAKTAAALETGLGLHTVEDLLRHYPRRYAQRGQLTDLASIADDEHVTVMARVSKCVHHEYQDKRIQPTMCGRTTPRQQGRLLLGSGD